MNFLPVGMYYFFSLSQSILHCLSSCYKFLILVIWSDLLADESFNAFSCFFISSSKRWFSAFDCYNSFFNFLSWNSNYFAIFWLSIFRFLISSCNFFFSLSEFSFKFFSSPSIYLLSSSISFSNSLISFLYYSSLAILADISFFRSFIWFLI